MIPYYKVFLMRWKMKRNFELLIKKKKPGQKPWREKALALVSDH